MRITGGKYRNKLIEAKEERTLRPTTSKVREAMFNIIKHGRFYASEDYIEDDNPSRIENRRVIDLFCGTGALGMEALSRGAAHAVFVDQNRELLALARGNIERINETANASFIRSDSTQLPPATIPCDLAFVDPPYRQNLAKPALKTLRDQGWLAHGAIVILESGKQDDPPEQTGYNLLDTRLHDKTRLSIYQFSS